MVAVFFVEDFFGDADGDADASASVVFFLVEVVVAAVDFFVVEVACVAVGLVDVAVVSFFWAQEMKNATATMAVMERTDFFIGCG